MTRFVVTKSVDAFLNYVAIVDAPDAHTARQMAKDQDATLAWKEDGVSEMDEVDFDNVPPEPMADDFQFGKSDAELAEEMKAQMLVALKLAWNEADMSVPVRVAVSEAIAAAEGRANG